MKPDTCFHCGLPNPYDPFELNIEGQTRYFCCLGCQSAAQNIIEAGLGEYYKFHQPDQQPIDIFLNDQQTSKLEQYNNADFQSRFVQTLDDHRNQAIFIIEGISCSACSWLIDKRLQQLEGVEQAIMNAATHRLTLTWRANEIALADIIKALMAIGYNASPYLPDQEDEVFQRTQKDYILRLGVAGIGMMQAMMNTVALYSGEIMTIHERWIWWASMVLTLPVILISARPFFTAAIRSLFTKSLSMDVSVSLAILSAFIASVIATITGEGEVYYESVNMFTFFLVLSRFLEFRARSQSALLDRQRTYAPTVCWLLDEQGRTTAISAERLLPGMQIRVLPGETCPADGKVIMGRSEFDESSFTGEFAPQRKTVGDPVLTGTINVSDSVDIEVTQTGAQSSYNLLNSLIEQASHEKPRLAVMADKGSQQFVWSTLIISFIIGVFWYWYDADRAFWVVISVLVVTCPCALSLATPTALAQAAATLKRKGLVLTKGYSLERLADIQAIAFDKTGTLTEGQFTLQKVELVATRINDIALTESHILALCAYLERKSEHPIAKAFRTHHKDAPLVQFSDVTVVPGFGIRAKSAEGDWSLNAKEPIQRKAGHSQSTALELTLNDAKIAEIHLEDRIRPVVKELLEQLSSRDITSHVLTGDRDRHKASAYADLGISGAYLAGQTPENKLDWVTTHLPNGAFVGDGINDGPVLAGAHLSIAVNNASDLSKTQADAILLNGDLRVIGQAVLLAQKTQRIIRQNLAWALVYNGIALPVAAMGIVSPWQAAIGMSASSLLVVLNALRLRK